MTLRHAGMLPRATALGLAGLAALPGVSAADTLRDEIEQLRASLREEIAALKAKERQLDQQVLRLDQKSQLLDRQLQSLRAAGVGRPAGTAPPADSPARRRPNRREPPVTLAQQVPAEPSPEPARPTDQAAPIAGPSAREQQAQRALEVATPVSSSGGILTPKGQVVIAPSLGYDYTAQNQLGVNGFQIIPGIIFGNFYVNRVEQYVTTGAVTARVGVTNRFELNVRVPYLYNLTTTTSTIGQGPNSRQFSVNATNAAIGDIQAGASYQINAGLEDWPIFIGNVALKSTTGVSPYEVPIFLQTDPGQTERAGLPRKTSTGTGFYSVSPSLTMIYPSAPGTLFANLSYVNTIGARVSIRDRTGGPSTTTNLTPGQAVGLTAGVGFALNERTSLSLSYQQQYVFESLQNGRSIPGSAYSFGSFNFGIGYELSERTRLNANVAIGVGPNTPAARLLIEVPYRFSL